MRDPSAPAIDRLLVHREWLERVARRLAADPAAADDLSQATWLAAIERPPSDTSHPRAWLATVLRRAISRSRRAAGRRARHEGLAARRDVAETAADAAERAESVARLAAALAALPEPFRTAVVLRHLDGCPVAEVAARTGVPSATARTRVHRGLTLLRARLDDGTRETDRTSRALAALPLLRTLRGCVAEHGARGVFPAAGGVLMTGAQKAAVAALVLVLAVVATVRLVGDVAPTGRAAAPSEGTNVAQRTPKRHAPRVASAADDASAAAPTSAIAPADAPRPADAATAGTVEVVVEDDEGRVVPGAVVTAAWGLRRSASATTDARGAAAIVHGRGALRLLSVAPPETRTDLGPFSAGAAEIRAQMRIRLPAVAPLRVRVTGPGDSPIDGIWVRALPVEGRFGPGQAMHVRTNADGVGEIAMPRSAVVDLVVVPRAVRVDAGRVTTVDSLWRAESRGVVPGRGVVELRAEPIAADRELAVEVVRPDGAPAAHVRVVLRMGGLSDPVATAVADATGLVRFASRPDAPHDVEVDRESLTGSVLAAPPVTASPGPAPTRIALLPGRTVRGRVVRDDGTACAWPGISVTHAGTATEATWAGRDDGSFEIVVPAEGAVALRAFVYERGGGCLTGDAAAAEGGDVRIVVRPEE